jgi:hypothetical protein
VDGVCIGALPSLVIANFFMEDIEEVALSRGAYKPIYCFCYVDDTFVIWPHGPEELNDFLNHANSIHPNTQFTMKNELDGHLPFLDIDIYTEDQMATWVTLYRKLTYTNMYLTAESHHHPANKHSVLSTLVHS